MVLALHDLGGSGPPLLIAHATGFLTAPYKPLAAGLTDQFHVFGLDLRAHGDSTPPTSGEITWSGAGDDVLAAVDAIGAPVTGFGHSMGRRRAADRRAGPARHRPVGLPLRADHPAVAAPGDVRTRRQPAGRSARKRRASFPSRADALARYASRPPLGLLRADALALYVEEGFEDAPDGTVTLKCRPEDEAATFEAAGFLTTADVTELELPVTVAAGDRHDGFGPPMFVPAIVEALPRGELLAYAHLDHFGPFQDPDTMADDVITRTRA